MRLERQRMGAADGTNCCEFQKHTTARAGLGNVVHMGLAFPAYQLCRSRSGTASKCWSRLARDTVERAAWWPRLTC